MGLLKNALLATAFTAASFALAAQAQQGTDLPGGDGQVYAPEDFLQFNPRTALDMVERIPGFSIQRDDDGSRGLGQASGNVLLNGQRLSGKSNSAEDALARIPAGSVVRIEVREGAELDIPGLSGQVANVVYEGEEGISGTWRWQSRFREDLPPYFDNFSVSLNGSRGALNWTFEVESDPERGANAGEERVFNAAGDLTEVRDDDFNFIADIPKVSGSLAWKPANGHIANVNGSYQLFQAEVKEISQRFPLGGSEVQRRFTRAEDEWNGELGGDYELALGPGRFKLIGLAKRENSPFVNRLVTASVDGASRSESLFEQTIDEGEYILRSEYAWSPRDGIDWQMAAEGAFNFIDTEAALFTSEGNAPLTEVALTNATSRVEEERGEITLTHGRQLTPKLNLQVTLGAEQSELSQSGPTGQTRMFTRPKGNVIATYKANDDLTLTTRLEREVGQLNFFDFISSVNLNDDRTNTGNTGIVPSQSWVLELTAERDFGKWGAATLEVFGEDIEDIVDRIPIGTGDGPGNIDSAWRIGAELSGTLKFDPIGVEGAQLEFEVEVAKSRVDDPLTGESRGINRNLRNFFFLEFRHDIAQTDWAYGVFVERFRGTDFFTLNEIASFENSPAFGFAFVEHKDIRGMTGSMFLGNIFNQQDRARREFYEPNRLGPLTSVEEQRRRFGPVLTLQLEGSF